MIGVILQTFSQQQCPGMNIRLLNTMHVSIYESAKDLTKSIFCNLAPSISDKKIIRIIIPGWKFYLKKTQTKQEHVYDPARNDDGVNRSKLDIPKESTKQMIK